jgi:FtsP/CotA-like multicopper oxidase with cupredoxin domain
MRALLRHRGSRRALRAFDERLALVEAGVTRRDLVKLGLLAGGGAGSAVLSSDRALADGERGPGALGSLPPLAPFAQELEILPVLPVRDRAELDPAPASSPNRATNPATGLPWEGRSEPHQSADVFPPQTFHVTRMGANTKAVVHPGLPAQTVWGFNLGGEDLAADPPLAPGPVLVLRYREATVVRRHNALPPPEQNGGFGVPEVSTHLHNFHSAADSDGGPCDPVQQRFFFRGQYYDYFYNMRFAGWNSTHPPDGDIREALGTLWYHDHRVDHTAENTYKGLVGPVVAWNELDTGDESTGLHLPQFPDYDIPLVFGDRLFDPRSGLLAFDTFNTDGLLGNVFLVNGRSQPFLEVEQRRYRFRLLDAGPSRLYAFFLTNPDDLGQSIPFLLISDDGNLLPRPIQTTSIHLSVAERNDVIVDFARIAKRFGAKRLILENRLEQVSGRAPTGRVLPAGAGDQLLEFRIGEVVEDGSLDYEPLSSPGVPAREGDSVFGAISLPDVGTAAPRITRTFRFARGKGGWVINGELMDCTRYRFTVEKGRFERWIIENTSGGWQHPVHIHMEEFRILSRNGVPIAPGDPEYARKDVVHLGFGDRVEILVRFRDMTGGYPLHCHNTVHEDHQMMMLYEVADVGDDRTTP